MGCSKIVTESGIELVAGLVILLFSAAIAMSTTYCFNQAISPAGALAEDFSYLSAERDFMTPDGRLVPRALGEAALRQRTALLIGGLLVGFWPTQL